MFDHSCKPLTELSGIPTTPRGWVLNKYGRCEFSVGYNPMLAQSVQKWQERYFQFGNLLHIEHVPSTNWTLVKNGKLPVWTGIILPDRNWDIGIGHVTAYSAESILAFCPMPHVALQGTPKTMLTEIISRANTFLQRYGSGIVFQPGVVDDLPVTISDDLRTNAYDHILKVIADSGMDWDITGSVDEKGNLQLQYNLYQRKGIDTILTLDTGNTELQGTRLREQGTIVNVIQGYSQASTVASRFGPLTGIHQAALDDYGPLGLNVIFSGNHDPASVQTAAQVKADLSGQPAKRFTRIALDKAKTFDYLNTGNTAAVKETKIGFNPNGGYGFESQVRIISMDYNDLSNKTPLTVEVL